VRRRVFCREHGTVSAYRKVVRKPSGKAYVYWVCSRCSTLAARDWYWGNRNRRRARDRAWYWANRDSELARNARWFRKNRPRRAAYRRRRVFLKTGRLVLARRTAA
jgi:hypothetical protein